MEGEAETPKEGEKPKRGEGEEKPKVEKKAPKDLPGTIVREEAPDESMVSLVAIFLLTIIEFIFLSLFTVGLLKGWEQETLATWLGMAFVVLGFILIFYRRSFVPDVLIVKARRKKHEDLQAVRE